MIRIMTTNDAIVLTEGLPLVDDCVLTWESKLVGGDGQQGITIFESPEGYLCIFITQGEESVAEVLLYRHHMLAAPVFHELCDKHDIIITCEESDILPIKIRCALSAYIKEKFA